MTLPELQQSQLTGVAATVIEIGARLQRNCYGDCEHAHAICAAVDAVTEQIQNAPPEAPVTVLLWPHKPEDFVELWQTAREAVDNAAALAHEAETARKQAVESLQSLAAQFELPQ